MASIQILLAESGLIAIHQHLVAAHASQHVGQHFHCFFHNVQFFTLLLFQYFVSILSKSHLWFYFFTGL